MTTALDPLHLAADILDPPEWHPEGRPPLQPHQQPPPGDWNVWVLAGGRGAGKTEGGARYYARHMRANPGTRGRIIGPTLGDVIEACVEGPSGLLNMDPQITFRPSAPGGAKLTWPNGSEALLIGTPTPRDVDRLRAAGNRHIDWWEEAAANPQLDGAWAQAEFGLRLGDHPHSIVTTTPRNTRAYRDLLNLDGTIVTRGTIRDNPHLPDTMRERLEARYAGTRLGRQELDGELIEDVEGALWTMAMCEAAYRDRPTTLPELVRVVVAIDPATTSSEGSDDTGIIVAARTRQDTALVLADYTCHESPAGWARRALHAFDEHEADRIVAEVNQGGEMVEHTIRTERPRVPFTAVHATRGKQIRAEPVSALYEQGRVHHLHPFPELVDELTTWTPGEKSPDRLDALVWAVTALDLTRPTEARKVRGPRR